MIKLVLGFWLIWAVLQALEAMFLRWSRSQQPESARPAESTNPAEDRWVQLAVDLGMQSEWSPEAAYAFITEHVRRTNVEIV
jgi:hypothetical protein